MNPKLQLEDNKVLLTKLEAHLENASKALSMAVLRGDLSAVEQTSERIQWAEQAFIDWREHALAVLQDRREILQYGPQSQVPGGGIKSQAQSKRPAGTKTGGKKSL